jgi:hypothetical protein
MFPDAVPVALLELAVAVIVTFAGVGTAAGAVYRPAALIVPPPFTLHVNVALGLPGKNAVNCAIPFTGTLVVPGNTSTALGVTTGGGGGVGPCLTPPQPVCVKIANAPATARKQIPPIFRVIIPELPKSSEFAACATGASADSSVSLLRRPHVPHNCAGSPRNRWPVSRPVHSNTFCLKTLPRRNPALGDAREGS